MGPRILSQEGCRYDMITLQSAGVRWQKGTPVPASVASPADREKTMAYQTVSYTHLTLPTTERV